MPCGCCETFIGNPCACCRTHSRIGWLLTNIKLAPVQDLAALQALRDCFIQDQGSSQKRPSALFPRAGLDPKERVVAKARLALRKKSKKDGSSKSEDSSSSSGSSPPDERDEGVFQQNSKVRLVSMGYSTAPCRPNRDASPLGSIVVRMMR